jgi:endoglycosylceramidase
VVLLRGANYSGLEFGNFFGSATPPEEADFAQMAGWGFGVVRLPIAWHYIETAPGVYDDAYLRDQVDPVLDLGARHHIGFVLEMHQYEWSACTGGNGAPEWSCEGREYTRDMAGVARAGCDFWSGVDAPDGRPLLDHFVDLWAFVAQRYAAHRAVTGFDLFNEPPNIGCAPLGDFERQHLFPLYRRLARAIRARGAVQMLFIEPPILRAAGIAAAMDDDPGDANVVYAPHLYTPQLLSLPGARYSGNRDVIVRDVELARAEADALGAPLWVGEFGGDTHDAFLESTSRFIRDHLDVQDAGLLGGAVWAHFPTDNTFSVVDAAGREKGDLRRILTRPYARHVAGVPTHVAVDDETGAFRLTYVKDPAGGDVEDPTVVFAGAAVRYPQGFEVTTRGIDHWTYDATNEVLLVYRDRDAMHHTVCLRPRR